MTTLVPVDGLGLLVLGMNLGVGVVQRTTPTPKFIPRLSNADGI